MVAPAKWSEEKDAVLKAHWGRIRPREIGKMLGTTKNAVIGRAHRIGMPHTTAPAQLKLVDTQGRAVIGTHYVRPTTPPSEAMIRLARHCPVTARAMELRIAA